MRPALRRALRHPDTGGDRDDEREREPAPVRLWLDTKPVVSNTRRPSSDEQEPPLPHAPTIALLYIVSLGLIAIAFFTDLLSGRTPATRFPLCVSLLLIAALVAFTPLWLIATNPAARAAFAAEVRTALAAREGRGNQPAPSQQRWIAWGVPDADAALLTPISLRARVAPTVSSKTRTNHCQDPAVWTDWATRAAQRPHDLELHGLHALWMGLCIKVERGDISVDDGITLFERARTTLVHQRRTPSPGE